MKKIIPLFALLIVSLVFVGCEKPKTDGDRSGGGAESRSGDAGQTSGKPAKKPTGGHGLGPNEGFVSALGRHEFHIETTVDKDTDTVTAYLYDGSHDNVPTDADVAEVVYNLVVDGAPKTFTIPRASEATETVPATYSLQDAELAGLIYSGWVGGGQLQIVIDGHPKTGRIVIESDTE